MHQRYDVDRRISFHSIAMVFLKLGDALITELCIDGNHYRYVSLHYNGTYANLETHELITEPTTIPFRS